MSWRPSRAATAPRGPDTPLTGHRRTDRPRGTHQADRGELSRYRNVRLCYSCDRDTGIPARAPRRVRLAWMQTSAADLPPRADLVFRVHRLRRTVAKRVAPAVVRPVENGATGHRTDCGRCRLCID